MSLDYSTPRAKPPTLSPSEIAKVQVDFIAEVERELIVAGEKNADTSASLREMVPLLTVTPRTGGKHDVTYSSAAGNGRFTRPRDVARYVTEVAAERAARLALGPDPVELLASRLVELGVPAAEARSRAAGRVRRLEDGRVAAYGDGHATLYDGGPKPSGDREYTPAELAVFRDPKEALARATRAILEERERKVNPTPAPAANAAVQGAF